MTQLPNEILLRIERLLNAGKQQEAQVLLVEYIKENPASARGWWLMSLTLTDVNRQVDCLQRVLRLDPGNEQARERLSKLVNQPPVSPPETPFHEMPADEKEKPAGEAPQVVPAWAATEEMAASVPPQTAVKQNAPPLPPAPTSPYAKGMRPRKSQTKWLVLFVLMAVFIILVVAFLAGYWWLQRQADATAQAQQGSLQQTFSVGQTLTSFPLPTLIPTWTASPSSTVLPSATRTKTPTLTLENSSTRTPIPPDLIAPVVGMFPPDFNLTDPVTAQQVSLYPFLGKPALLFFWVTWCPSCSSDIASIETIAQTYKDAGLVVLTIDVAEDSATVSAFLSTHPLTIPILPDPDSATQTAYLVDSIPGYFFINSNGTIAFIGRGEMTLEEIKVQVDAIMK